MKIYPAIDLIGGQVVRLAKGDYQKKTVYGEDPLTTAQDFQKQGAEYLHVVDLDGAKDPEKRQVDLIGRIVRETGLKVQTGGGIRSLRDAANLLDQGVDRIIIGSMAVKNQSETLDIIKSLGAEHITLGLDVQLIDQKPMVAIHGWQEVSTTSADQLLKIYQTAGVTNILCTDISKDGMLTGPNFDLYRQLQQNWPDLDFIASGGIHSLDDLAHLKQDNTSGVIIGKALYEGRFNLKEALQC